MKKSIKVLGTTALILAFAAAPALARNNRPGKGNNMPDFAQMNNCPVYAQNCQPGFNGQNKKAGRNGCGIGRISIMGTVSAIDESKSILTVSDIDGVEHKVHISEFTRACTLDAATRTTALNPKADIKDFKKGDKVAVSTFDTETKTLEARSICTIK